MAEKGLKASEQDEQPLLSNTILEGAERYERMNSRQPIRGDLISQRLRGYEEEALNIGPRFQSSILFNNMIINGNFREV